MATSPPTIDVFIENPKGAIAKIHHDEQALVPTHCELVAAPYVYAYGFVIGVPSGDGDMLDCFVISDRVLYTGDRLDCVPVGYLEQWENDHEDFDIIAVPASEAHLIDSIDLSKVHDDLTLFIAEVFSNIPDRTLRAGDIHGSAAAYDLLERLSPS